MKEQDKIVTLLETAIDLVESYDEKTEKPFLSFIETDKGLALDLVIVGNEEKIAQHIIEIFSGMYWSVLLEEAARKSVDHPKEKIRKSYTKLTELLSQFMLHELDDNEPLVQPINAFKQRFNDE